MMNMFFEKGDEIVLATGVPYILGNIVEYHEITLRFSYNRNIKKSVF